MTTPRSAAKTNGDRFYETGKPCIRGHVAPRTTSNASCTVCTAELNATPEVKRKRVANTLRWRAAHPEVSRASISKWQLANPEKVREAGRRYKAKQRVRFRAEVPA
jgi:hypothetical protein